MYKLPLSGGKNNKSRKGVNVSPKFYHKCAHLFSLPFFTIT